MIAASSPTSTANRITGCTGRLVTNIGSTRRIDAERFLVDVLQAGHLNRSALIHKLSWRELKDEH
jgi:hypothetical protein